MAAEPAPAVEARGLTQAYRHGQQRVTALENVTLCVPLGGVTALIGPSGAGKSTLLHLMAGLTRPAAGELRVAGRNLLRMNERALARFRNHDVGVIFQAFNLLPDLTVRENIFFPLYFGGVHQHDGAARVSRLLDIVGLEPLADRLPAQLSGGEQQRVAIARALVTNPALILADEPTGNLDEATAGDVAGLLFNLANRFSKTLILVTHHRELARRADRRIGIVGGRVVPEDQAACS
ncbi:MAG TPA: ABC transporter ATP-binding protein [Chloroflexota bacterium]|jgi:ABC-type lipoprotein export system ATPase subunit|nr:ABC transporter ATP-binding protein [Chloroflexota bacterium]